jgi:alpha-L-rhamnosidase
MDAGYGIYVGATQRDFIASAYFAYSTALVIKAGKILGEDTTYFEELYKNVRAKFRECFMKDGMPVALREYKGAALDDGKGKDPRPIKDITQTAIVLILHFGLCEPNEREALVEKLCELIRENDGRMTTGFVGTPYILHALSDNGKATEAFDLLLQEKAPSWLFSVNMGATTIWEHWDSVDENGKMWSTDMNSFNHYAYGSVFDWVFGDMLGIKVDDDGAAYEKITIAPLTDKRIGFAEGSIDTRNGEIFVSWRYIGDKVRYDIRIPENTVASFKIKGHGIRTLGGGSYTIIK